MKKDSKIFVAGHKGMVGSAIVRRLEAEGYTNIITASRYQCDLTKTHQVESFFEKRRPEYVFNCAAKVGGILANNEYRADFIVDNVLIATNLTTMCHYFGVKQYINLGSSCIYPMNAHIPIQEHALFSGPLEYTNKPYAVAKLVAVEMCDAFNKQHDHSYISLMPTNLYGLNDTYDDKNSHVIPAMIQRFHKAKVNGDSEVVVWGDGTPMREFLFADDLAEACVFMMEKNHETLTYWVYNVGSKEEVSIHDLAYMIKYVVGFEGDIRFDTTKPNGTMRKKLNTWRMEELGWEATTKMKDGLKVAYNDYLERFGNEN